MRKYRTPVMVMAMRTYRARWIMELSTFRPPGPDFLGPASVPFAAVLLCAVVPGASFPLVADVVTSSTACTEKQQNRTRTRTHTRNELIPTAADNSSLKTEPSQKKLRLC